MAVPDEPGVQWRKSSRSDGQNNCVEVGAAGNRVLIRHSKRPEGPCLRVTRKEWLAFLKRACTGELRPN